VSQKAAEAALAAQLDTGEGKEHLRRMRAAFAQRRELVARLLDDVPGVSYVKPQGAFYYFVDVAAHFERFAGGAGSRGLAEYLLEEAGVAVVPGVDFGDDRAIRISFATSAEDLTVALKRIAKALGPEARSWVRRTG
jgi:aspartate aminotransferase